MTANRPGGGSASPQKGTPPVPSRRSARQERLAARDRNRSVERAKTRPRSGSSPLMLWTVVAVVAAIAVIGAAILITNKPAAQSSGSLAAIHAPAVATPDSLPRDGLTLGKADAPVKIDLWSDFQCVYCGQFTREDEPLLVKDYIGPGKAKLVYHDLIVIDSGPGGTTESLDAANAARCASDQGKFWQYHDYLFWNQVGENVGGFTKPRLTEIGRQAGLDMTKFQACVDGNTHVKEIQAETPPQGLSATPGIYVNGISTGQGLQPYATITAAIDKALAGSSASPSASASASASPSASASASGS